MAKYLKPQTVTALIFLFILLVRLPGLDHSPAEYHGWRQSDTEAIARNFAQHRLNIFYPQLNYDGPLPNYAQLEFQITTFIIAIGYRLFGYHYLLARSVPLIFFLGSAYYLYRLGQELAGQTTGWLALLVYGTFPFCVFFSRAIMPESAALFFMVASLYYFVIWLRTKNKPAILFLSAGLTALAISEKIPAGYIGIPIAYLFMREYGSRALKNPSIWGYALIAIMPPLLYFVWLEGIAETDYVSGIASNLLLPAWLKQIWPASTTVFLSQGLSKAYTPMALGLALSGLLLLDWRRDKLLISWTAAAALEILFVAAIIQLDYYLLLIAPLVALLAAISLHQLSQNSVGRIVLCGFVLLTVLLGWQETGLHFQEEKELLRQAQIVEKRTAETDLLVFGTYSPELLNLSRRYGWRANIFYPQDPQKEMGFFISNKAAYFVVANGRIEGDEDGSYYQYLREHYDETQLPNGLSIFALQDE